MARPSSFSEFLLGAGGQAASSQGNQKGKGRACAPTPQNRALGEDRVVGSEQLDGMPGAGAALALGGKPERGHLSLLSIMLHP